MTNIFLRMSLAVLVGMTSAAILNRVFNFFFMTMFLAVILGTTFFICVLMQYLKKFSDSDLKRSIIFSSVSAVASLQLFLLSFIPLTIDRSYSVWLLNELSKDNLASSSVVDLSRKTDVFFLSGDDEINRRLKEQQILGNVKISEVSKVSLTNKGKIQVALNRAISNFFGLEPKYARNGSL